MRKFSIELKWAIALTILSFLWSLLEKQMGLHDNKISKHMLYNMIFTFLALPVYFLALRDKKVNYFYNSMTWSQGFVSGAIISVIMALLSPLITLITYKVVSPHYFENAVQSAVSRGATLANAQMYFNLESYMLQNAFTAISMGLVVSAGISMLLKNK